MNFIAFAEVSAVWVDCSDLIWLILNWMYNAAEQRISGCGNRSTTRRFSVALGRVPRETHWFCCLELNQILSMRSTRRTKHGNRTRYCMFCFHWVYAKIARVYALKYTAETVFMSLFMKILVSESVTMLWLWNMCLTLLLLLLLLQLLFEDLSTFCSMFMIYHRTHWVQHQQQKLSLKTTVHTSMVTFRFFNIVV